MTLHGYIFASGEECLERIIWYFQEDGANWNYIEEGDHLKITTANGKILFDGIIEPAEITASGWPIALGHEVNWIQKGWDPDEWAKLFFQSGTPLRAELTKKETKQ